MTREENGRPAVRFEQITARTVLQICQTCPDRSRYRNTLPGLAAK